VRHRSIDAAAGDVVSRFCDDRRRSEFGTFDPFYNRDTSTTAESSDNVDDSNTDDEDVIVLFLFAMMTMIIVVIIISVFAMILRTIFGRFS